MVAQRLLGVLFFCLISNLCYALSAEELEDKIHDGSHITIIDIRSTFHYRQAHINNAINIPSLLLCKKNLSFAGDLVVYGDGIDIEQSEKSIACLLDRMKSPVYLLDGGYPAWSALKAGTAASKGLSISQDKYISYQRLVKLSQLESPPVLVDLRTGESIEVLSDHFPLNLILSSQSSSEHKVQSVISQSMKYKNRLIVIIGGDIGLSNRVVSNLHAAGVKRVARLVGGEHSLKARGVSKEAVLTL